MKRLVVALLLMVACAAEEDLPVDSVSEEVLSPLPGGCNNPLICTSPIPGEEGGGGGGGQQMCHGCICQMSADECSRCEHNCYLDYLRCVGSFPGPSADGCKAIQTGCRQDCQGRDLTCVCPR